MSHLGLREPFSYTELPPGAEQPLPKATLYSQAQGTGRLGSWIINQVGKRRRGEASLDRKHRELLPGQGAEATMEPLWVVGLAELRTGVCSQ